MSTTTADHPMVERRTRPRAAGSRRFFEQLIVSRKVKRGRTKAVLLPIAAALHVIALAAVILVPLLMSQDLPQPTTAGGIRAFFVEPAAAPPPPPPPPAPPKARAATAPKPTKVEAPKPVEEPKFVAPVETPPDLPVEEVAGTEGAELADAGVVGGVEGGVAGGVEGGTVGGVEGGTVGGELGGQIGGVIGGATEAPPPPPSEPVRVGGNIKEPQKLKNIPPVYPDVAKQARVQGTVILEATIDTSGRVDNVRVLRGIPLLNEAALSAVRKWVYSPTMLNGTPVPVIMTVTVNFQLS
jgi:periplasmic protein TonB